MVEFLDRAMSAHNLWKSRLRTAIEGGEIPDERKTGADDLCDLGKWLYGGESTEYHSLLEFADLKSKHAQFHMAAARVIGMIRKGKTTGALGELRSGEYAKASTSVILAIKALKNRLGK
ncbi:MAG TPA: hypothetical protein DCP63_08095 [Bacteroidetes bacterium]|nr:hypothetical protein [Bacteroidota bacterium]